MGERVEDLIPALLKFRDNMTPTDDGWWTSECDLSHEEAVPLCRALMRVEARLLREDANRLKVDDGQSWRTPEQRSADAFVALVKMLPRRA
jgi:hypothetical protein